MFQANPESPIMRTSHGRKRAGDIVGLPSRGLDEDLRPRRVSQGINLTEQAKGGLTFYRWQGGEAFQNRGNLPR
jgi:hypothetical protein